MYKESDVRVIESKTVGDGYAALSMLDVSSGDTDAIVEDLNFCMEGVVTASVSKTVRDADMGIEVHAGDYIGFVGKDILSSDPDRAKTATLLIDNMDTSSHDIFILINGKDSTPEETAELQEYLAAKAKGSEIYTINGEQDIYSYIIIAE